MLLSVLVEIFNTRNTFPVMLCFITSESAAIFDFMVNILDKLFFYNCPCAIVVFIDFLEGLAKSIMTYEIKR